MSRFYVPKEYINSGEINIRGKEAHHILGVMRLKEGDEVRVFDGTGCEYVGFIKEANEKGKRVTIEVIRTERPSETRRPEIVLAQAVPKKKKMEYIVEKATELGVSKIIPLISERTIVRPRDKKDRDAMTARWKRISLEASKQCGRKDVPEIEDMTLLIELMGKMEEYDLVLMACLTEERISLKEALRDAFKGKILILIGPEGDFSPEEARMVHKDNCKLISLGERVLKSDTAGLFVLSAISYELE
ncbi:MAG: RsmE family RNA methyltransferase [Candidatus Omnitrophota bacterium]